MTAQDDRNQVVVDTRHKDAVLAELRRRNVLPEGVAEVADENEALDLTLIAEFDPLKLLEYAQRARVTFRNEIAALATAEHPFTDLDVLLYDLRYEFADTGHLPVMGKNRDTVLGYPNHKSLAQQPKLIDPLDPIPPDGAGHGVVAGVVDTGIAEHDLLPAERVTGDPITDELTNFSGHATFIAGLIRQAAPGATVKSRAGLSSRSGEATCWQVATKMAALFDSGISVLNLSFGCNTADREPPLILRRAIDRVPDGVLVIAAAGNRNEVSDDNPVPPSEIWPAACTDVVAVGATQDIRGAMVRAEFSMDRDWVDCVAPGFLVPSLYPFGSDLAATGDDNTKGWARWSGTSFSAATVTGKVAAMLSQHPGLTARDAWQRLLGAPGSGVQRHPAEA